MATISTAHITAKIDPLWNDRSRDITYGESVSRLPYKVEVTDPGTATDVDELEEYVIAAAIEYFTSNPVGDTYFTRLGVDSTLNERTWKVVATFEGRGPWYSEAAGGNLPEFDFDTMGGQVHITASRSVAGAYPLGASAYYPGAIGVQGDSIAGTDIIVPAFNFNLTLMLDSIFVNDAYLQLLRLLTGSVNSDNWYGYAPGEVLFLGASGQRRGAESIRLTYKFSALPMATGGSPASSASTARTARARAGARARSLALGRLWSLCCATAWLPRLLSLWTAPSRPSIYPPVSQPFRYTSPIRDGCPATK